MQNALLKSLTLVDVSGQLIIALILLVLFVTVFANFVLHARYASMAREVRQGRDLLHTFSSRVIQRIVDEVREALDDRAQVNTQAIIEHAFQSHLKGLLLGERFVRSATGLSVILGLVGTFYGLTLSIGKLVTLVSTEGAGVHDMTQALTTGLTQALAGMAVAFTTSLFGIIAAIIVMMLGIFSNVTDRRTALMVQIEAFVDRCLPAPTPTPGEADVTLGAVASGQAGAVHVGRLERIVSDFGQAVTRLDGAVTHFESALNGFATTTRDFREFNLHLKDNVQRMSLSFGDLSEVIKSHVASLRASGRS